MAEFGRWHVLLSVLYTSGGFYDLNKPYARAVLASELELTASNTPINEDNETDRASWTLEGFLHACAELGLIDAELLKTGVVTQEDVVKEIQLKTDFAESRKEAGRASGEVRRKGEEKKKEISEARRKAGIAGAEARWKKQNKRESESNILVVDNLGKTC